MPTSLMMNLGSVYDSTDLGAMVAVGGMVADTLRGLGGRAWKSTRQIAKGSKADAKGGKADAAMGGGTAGGGGAAANAAVAGDSHDARAPASAGGSANIGPNVPTSAEKKKKKRGIFRSAKRKPSPRRAAGGGGAAAVAATAAPQPAPPAPLAPPAVSARAAAVSLLQHVLSSLSGKETRVTQAPPAGAHYHQHHAHHHAWRHYQIFNDGLLRRSLSPSCSVAWTRSWADRPTSALSPASSPRRCRRTTVRYTFSNLHVLDALLSIRQRRPVRPTHRIAYI